MKAVIMAAGEGKRMAPLTETRPKVMLPVANLPIMAHLVTRIRDAGILNFIFITGYQPEPITRFFSDGSSFGIHIDYITQRPQLGTAHALMMARDLLDGPFLLANGDIILGAKDISSLVAHPGHAMMLSEVADTHGLGTVEVDRGKVKRIHEKVANPPSNLANAGLYRLGPSIMRAIDSIPRSARGEYELTSALQMLIDGQEEIGYEISHDWLNLSYPWDLLSAQETLMKDMEGTIEGEVEENVVLKGPVKVGKGTIIRSGSYIVGPVIIGEGCDIGPNCYIRGSTSIGDGCHIGAAVEIKNTIMMNRSKAPHHNYIGDSVIGEECNFGAGTKIANLRLDKAEVRVGGLGTGTRRRKFGAAIGDRVQTGINASINTGSLIGSGTFIGPGALASGRISQHSRVL